MSDQHQRSWQALATAVEAAARRLTHSPADDDALAADLEAVVACRAELDALGQPTPQGGDADRELLAIMERARTANDLVLQRLDALRRDRRRAAVQGHRLRKAIGAYGQQGKPVARYLDRRE